MFDLKTTNMRMLIPTVALLAVCASGCSDDSPASEAKPDADTTASTGSDTDLLGIWTPTNARTNSGHDPMFVAFLPGGTWTGNDGCDRLFGRFTLADGKFTSLPQDKEFGVACASGPAITETLAKAVRAEIESQQVTFFNEANTAILKLKRIA